jgi:hypothetical protein
MKLAGVHEEGHEWPTLTVLMHMSGVKCKQRDRHSEPRIHPLQSLRLSFAMIHICPLKNRAALAS